MKKRNKSAFLVSAAVAGLLAGSLTLGGCSDSDKTKTEKNGCGGANGCGSKESEKNGCNGKAHEKNGCNGKEGEKNGCNGQEGKR